MKSVKLYYICLHVIIHLFLSDQSLFLHHINVWNNTYKYKHKDSSLLKTLIMTCCSTKTLLDLMWIYQVYCTWFGKTCIHVQLKLLFLNDRVTLVRMILLVYVNFSRTTCMPGNWMTFRAVKMHIMDCIMRLCTHKYYGSDF